MIPRSRTKAAMSSERRCGRTLGAARNSLLLVASLMGMAGCTRVSAEEPAAGACDAQLTLPPGFCAQVFATDLGNLRHVAVGTDGLVYVARWEGRGKAGGLLVLQDTDGDGQADSRVTIVNEGGSGIALGRDVVYMSTHTSVLRYTLHGGRPAARATPDTILTGLPRSGHAARSIALSADGRLLVNIGAPTNSCQVIDKGVGSLGRDPCPELERFAGLWSLDANRKHQSLEDGRRVITGVRHVVALAVHPRSGVLYGVQHGRDDLHENFPDRYDRLAGERLAAEEMFRFEPGRSYGWPYCYYDAELRRKVLAPEYGGDGRAVGRCAAEALPIYAFPAHWAPNSLLFYQGSTFPARYRGGAFVAFHGAWYRRAPNNGFNVVFLPLAGETPSGAHEVFADGFAGQERHPARALHRPVGLAEGHDGSVFVTDDTGGRIWRIVYSAAR